MAKRTCPECGSEAVKRIVYGMQAPETLESYDKGEIKLGGCCVSEDDPDWYCSACEHEWRH